MAKDEKNYILKLTWKSLGAIITTLVVTIVPIAWTVMDNIIQYRIMEKEVELKKDICKARTDLNICMAQKEGVEKFVKKISQDKDFLKYLVLYNNSRIEVEKKYSPYAVSLLKERKEILIQFLVKLKNNLRKKEEEETVNNVFQVLSDTVYYVDGTAIQIPYSIMLEVNKRSAK